MRQETGSDSPEPMFEPLAPDFIADPYPTYHRLRSHKTMFHSPIGCWVASRYEDVSLVIGDRRFGHDYKATMSATFRADILEEPAYRSISKSMLRLDPPDHTRIRNHFRKAFGKRRVQRMRQQIQTLANGLIDKVADTRQMDIIRDFAQPLPAAVICDLLGVPQADRSQVVRGFAPDEGRTDPIPMSQEELDRANASTRFLSDYFQCLIEGRRRKPAADLLTDLSDLDNGHGKLSTEELIANILLLFQAGLETTANLIGNGLLALHRNPSQLKLLKADPRLMPNAVKELLRYDTPVQNFVRTALAQVEVGGVTVAKGDSVLALFGAANRDPDVYANPDALDITRKGARPVYFGGGVHSCLGAQLACVEAEIAFTTLLRRVPDLQLETRAPPQWREIFSLRGLKYLPAHW